MKKCIRRVAIFFVIIGMSYYIPYDCQNHCSLKNREESIDFPTGILMMTDKEWKL